MRWRQEISMYNQSWLPSNFVILTFQSEKPEINLLALCFVIKLFISLILIEDLLWGRMWKELLMPPLFLLSSNFLWCLHMDSYCTGKSCWQNLPQYTQETLEKCMSIQWRILVLRLYLREVKDHCYGKMCPSQHFSN